MLISRIAQIDANAQRFAADHVTSLLAPSGGSDFDAYLARVMQRESTPGAIAQPSETTPAQTTPYYNDPYAPRSQNSYEAYHSESSRPEDHAQASTVEARPDNRAAEDRASDASREKQEKHSVDREKVDTSEARETDDAAREGRADEAQAADERDEANRSVAEQESDERAAQTETETRAKGESASGAQKAALESASDNATAAGARVSAGKGKETPAGATEEGDVTRAAAETSAAHPKARAANATAAAARGGSAEAKAGEAAEASGEAGATVELEVNLEAAGREAATDAKKEAAQKRDGELAASDAREEAAAKARPNDRVMSREATVAAAAREAVGRGEETGDQRREQAKQAKVDVSDLRPTNASERVDSGQTLANRDGGGTHQHSSNGESGSRSSGDLLGGEATRPPHGEARSLTNPTLNRAADQLSRHLQENLNSEIVRQAKFIVRTNESGEIKLHLRPESLGSVRVALQMQDGHIAGRIIVDNQTVREVFEQNLASLERAFLEQGLETGGLDVMVADSGGQGREQEETTRSRKSVADRGRSVLAGAVPTIENYDTHELVDVTV